MIPNYNALRKFKENAQENTQMAFPLLYISKAASGLHCWVHFEGSFQLATDYRFSAKQHEACKSSPLERK